ncbi:MAG: hypothetical protein ABIQ30_07255 [Devosia sp.]
MHIEIGEGIRSVLILEDEGIVAMMMEDLVRELRVRDVHVCADVESALKVLRNEDIDCAVLDLWLRGDTSRAVADACADQSIPFLFSTGSDLGAIDDRHAGRPMIGKPFADDDFKLVLVDTWSRGRGQPASMLAAASA